VSEASSSPEVFFKKHHFLLRRLHSLSGIVPVGIFVIMHLFTNFQLIAGDYQHEVEFIHSLPALLFMEIAIWGGIGFHAALGVCYMMKWLPNVRQYTYADNWRYFLQRITGWIALIFIFLHIATLRWRWNIAGWDTPFFVAAPDGTPLVAASTAMALQTSAFVVFLYVVGVFSVVFHWCNGLWTAAITWGLTISVNAQRRWGYACAVLGIALSIFSAGAILGALQYQLSDHEKSALQSATDLYKTTGQIIHSAKPHSKSNAASQEVTNEETQH